MKKTCIDCSSEFIITDSEEQFYKSKNLQIPKRCKACRDKRKNNGTTNSNIEIYTNEKNGKSKNLIKIGITIILCLCGYIIYSKNIVEYLDQTTLQTIEYVNPPTYEKSIILIEPSREEQTDETIAIVAEKKKERIYSFRSDTLLEEHYEKHKNEFSYATTEEYEIGANIVIQSEDALKKREADDGDYIFYLEATNEIVFLSTRGNIRTYFKPDSGKSYYDRQ